MLSHNQFLTTYGEILKPIWIKGGAVYNPSIVFFRKSETPDIDSEVADVSRQLTELGIWNKVSGDSLLADSRYCEGRN